MLSSPSIGVWGPWVLSGVFLLPKTILLSSSAITWSFKLNINAFPSGIETGRTAGSFRKDTFLEESLPVVALGVVGVLESSPMLSSSLSPEEDEEKTSGEGFLEAEEAETLLEEHLAMQWVWSLSLKWTHFPALELALENKLSESGDSPTLFELFWNPGGSVVIVSDFSWFFGLTMVAVKGKEVKDVELRL